MVKHIEENGRRVYMKVLSVAWTIYDDRIKIFSKNCTGGGLFIKNICEYIGRRVDSYLLIGKFVMPSMLLGNIKIFNTDRDYDISGQDRNDEHIERMTLAFIDALDEISPDIVNFHGTGVLAKRCIEKCIQLNIPFVYTEHLYICRNRLFSGYDKTFEWSDAIFKIPNLKIIAVSTGMKRNILMDYPDISPDNVKVIVTGTDFVADLITSNLREKYSLANKKVLVCAGSICDRKNQSQIIKAFKLLPIHLQKSLIIILCGIDRTEGRFEKDIHDNDLQEHLIYMGAISSDDMKKVYSISDGLIMPSYSEGLSIAALEMITYGKPVIMFKDSECADDLNDTEVVCFAENRTDEKLSYAIIEWSEKKWDYQYIKEYACRFTMKKVINEYLEYYKSVLEGKVL